MTLLDQTPPTPLRDILTSDYGVIFFPKRPLDVPHLLEDQILSKFKPENSELVIESVNDLQEFLQSQAVGDNFGNDHEARRKWRAAMTSQFGDTFSELYQRNNQFRGNSLSLVKMGIKDLSNCARKNNNIQLADALQQIWRDVSIKYNGKDPVTGEKKGMGYNELVSLEDKYVIVQLFEDKALKTLSLLT